MLADLAMTTASTLLGAAATDTRTLGRVRQLLSPGAPGSGGAGQRPAGSVHGGSAGRR